MPHNQITKSNQNKPKIRLKKKKKKRKENSMLYIITLRNIKIMFLTDNLSQLIE